MPQGIPDELAASLYARRLAGERMEVLAIEAGCTPESLYRRFRRVRGEPDRRTGQPQELPGLFDAAS